MSVMAVHLSTAELRLLGRRRGTLNWLAWRPVTLVVGVALPASFAAGCLICAVAFTATAVVPVLPAGVAMAFVFRRLRRLSDL
ncbi:hypothetical protein ACGFX4_39330 [Kitasatospora sp. NPDC048365]|uniref:hypothetical protein n=1 Tax=Kitasatospora sp. NPDC048365 TaxID=3364050 RepID=UPI003718BAF0